MTEKEIPAGIAENETEAERAAAARAEREARASVQFALRLRRLAAFGSDDGNGNCTRCGKPFDYDDEGRPMHAEPITDCPVETPPVIAPRGPALVKDAPITESIYRPRRVKPFGERDDD